MPIEALNVPLRSRVRRVASDRPWVWITLGWRDMMAHRAISLSLGAALALFGWVLSLLLFELGAPWAILPATAGFFILAPLLATPLYEVSRRAELGETVTLHQAMQAFRPQIAMMGVLLLIIHLFWVRVAGLLFALFFGGVALPSLAQLPMAMLQSEALLPFLVTGTGIGCLLAAGSFALAAVSLPMLVDRDIAWLEAVTISLQAVMENSRAMALWAGLIVLFTGLALVPFFLGLVVVLPLVGHATWHAYRDLVVR